MKLSRKQRNALYRLPMTYDDWAKRYAPITRKSLIKKGLVESEDDGLIVLSDKGKKALDTIEG